MNFPAAPTTAISTPDGLPEALRAKPDAAYGTGALGDVLAVSPTRQTSAAWIRISPR
ncbi:MAG: hypothetical protein ABR615_11360 [Pseudonocardiaceae bacterium]